MDKPKLPREQAAARIETEGGKRFAAPMAEPPAKSPDETKLHGVWLYKFPDVGAWSFIFGPSNSVYRVADGGHNFNGDNEGTYSVDWSKNPHHLLI